MVAERDTIFEKPPEKKKQESSDDVMIYVMPKEFLGREANVRELNVQKTPLPPPIVPRPASVGPKEQPPVVPPAKRKTKGSRTPMILAGLGLILIGVLAIGGYYILQSIQPDEPDTIVDQTPDQIPDQTPDQPDQPDEPDPPQILAGRDTDSDGLTDREEALYGTDFRNPDTDGDTFLDGNEVFHRYDPLGFSPSTLLDTGSVIEYVAPADEFELTYPRTWMLTTTMEGVSLRSATGASVDILAEPKDSTVSFQDWLAQTYIAAGEMAPNLQSGSTKAGYTAYMSTDEMETFVVFDDVVYVFVYNLGTATTIDYLQTFQMIVNSFSVQ